MMRPVGELNHVQLNGSMGQPREESHTTDPSQTGIQMNARPGAFVHIIESPSNFDLLDGCSEGRLLGEALKIAEIPFEYSLATDEETLLEAVEARTIEAVKRFKAFPIFHLSMHGNRDGIQLTSREFITWNRLREILLPTMRAMEGNQLICMSSCGGAHAALMAQNEQLDHTQPNYWALIGHCGSPIWSDAAIAYSTFYHLFFKGIAIQDCIEAMRIASGDPNFHSFSGAGVRANWIAYATAEGELPQINLPMARERTPASDEGECDTTELL
jgi:hypothetical protein